MLRIIVSQLSTILQNSLLNCSASRMRKKARVSLPDNTFLNLFLILFREQTFPKIIQIALLVSLLASTYSIIGFLRWEISYASSLVAEGGREIIVEEYAFDCGNALEIHGGYVKIGNTSTWLIATDVDRLVKAYRAKIVKGKLESNGSYVGFLLSKEYSIQPGSRLLVKLDEREIYLNITAILRFNGPLDYAIIVPEDYSIREFSWLEPESLEACAPSSYSTIKTKNVYGFLKSVDTELLNLLNMWAFTVFILIAALSYVLTARNVREYSFELNLLRALGLSKKKLTALILSYAAVSSTLGALAGLAIGVTTAQILASILKWLNIISVLSPFLTPVEALKLIVLTVISSTAGAATSLLQLDTRHIDQLWLTI